MESNISFGRILKLAVSLLVYAATALRRGLLRLAGAKPAATCVVLYYHSVPASERMRFARQLDVLVRSATPLNLQQDIPLEPGRHYVAITFDDGFTNYMEQALPELVRRGLPSTNFLIADALGERFGRAGADEAVMSAETARAGLSSQVQFGSHTLTHPMLPLLTEEEMRREIVDSRHRLEAVLGQPVDTFSFPYGGFSPRAIELCAEAGYRRVFTTLPYYAFRTPDEFVVGRVRVDPADWPLEFWLKLSGAYRWLPCAITAKRALRNFVSAFTGRVQTARPTSRIRKNHPEDGCPSESATS